MSDKLKEIQAKIEALKLEEEKLINEQKQAIIDRLKGEIKTYHLKAEDLFEVEVRAKKKSKSKEKVVKYRNGDLTWSGGRGIKPQWVKELIEKEGEQALEKFKVAEV